MPIQNRLRSFVLFLFFSSKSLIDSFESSVKTSQKNSTLDLNSCSSISKMSRQVSNIITAQTPHWVGDGFRVYSVFGDYAFQKDHGLSPFLMFDYAAPKKFSSNKSGNPLGVGKHPHRGFETVTIAFQGEVEHADSLGARDVIKSGDVQWMTAGRGIIHQEYHSKNFSKTGGTFEMCQLWVNLPKKHKMTKPQYQPITSSQIPKVEIPFLPESLCDENISSAGTVKVIAGSFNGVKGPAKTFSPVELWDVHLPEKGLPVDLDFPKNNNCIIFVRKGKVDILGDGDMNKSVEVGPQSVAIMKNELGRSILSLRATEKNTCLLIIGGEPIDEPIAARGPFVMNTWDEIQQAIVDYNNGKMGR